MDLLKRYLAPKEDWASLCNRVSGIMMYEYERDEINESLVKQWWLPNSPTLVNAGKPGGRNLMACHLLHIKDSIEGIFEAVKSAAMIFKAGGGLGLEFSDLTPALTPLRYAPGGRASGPVSFMKVFDATARVVMEGGLRRAAIMGTLNAEHPDIFRFISAKEHDRELSNFNLSVTVNGSPGDVDLDVWEAIVNHAHWNGEPGVIFLKNVNDDNPTLKEYGEIKGVNACVTGDTLVAVADGRDVVSIKELAKQGADVPLYCQGPDGIVVRMGRHPRKTGMNVPVLKVTLNDGSNIRVTPDHNFMLRDGAYRPAKDLQVGDNLMPIYKYQYINRQAYWAIHLNEPGNHVAWAPEHRLIAEYRVGEKLRSSDYVVHHRDYDGLNNHWDNLEVLSADKHNQLHRDRMLGSNNPMRDGWWNSLSEKEKQAYRERMSELFSGSNNPMFGRHHSEETCRKIGRLAKARMTPERREHMRQMMLDWFAIHGSDHLKGDRIERLEIPCGYCKMIIRIIPSLLAHKRETNQSGKIFCCRSCAQWWRAKNTSQVRCSTEQILRWGTQYLEEKGELPTNDNWETWRKSHPDVCSRETIRQRFGGIRPFNKVIEQQNHTVSSIELCGIADVYNITVDEHHNLAYITNPNDQTPSGRLRMSGIITKNCGEICMYDNGSCILASVALPNVVANLGDWALLEKCVVQMVDFLNRIIDVNYYPLPAIAQQTRKMRRIGIGVMGWADLLKREKIAFVSREAKDLADDIAEKIYRAADTESGKLAENSKGYLPGRRRNVSLLAIAPTGHIARLAGMSHSIYPDYAEGLKMTAEQHLDHLAVWQRWVDNAISYTVSFSSDKPVGFVDQVFRGAFERGLKSISVYRDGSREGQPCKAKGACSV